MSASININVPQLGQPNSTEDPKIAANFTAIANWIASPQLAAADLAANSVTSTQIQDGSVGNAELATGAVTTTRIADSTGASDGVTSAKLATSAVSTDKLADSAVSGSKIRVFTRPQLVTAVPQTQNGTGGAIASVGATTITNLTFSNASTVGAPQVGQAVTVTTSGTYLSSDTVITAVSGSGTGPYTLTLNRPTVGSGSSLAVTVAPTNGDEILYVAGSGVLWHFRYVSTESVYRWLFVGGSSLTSGVLADNTSVTSTSYAAGTAGQYQFLTGGNIAGEFDVTVACQTNTGAQVRAQSAPVIGDGSSNWTTASDANAIQVGAFNPSTAEISVYSQRTSVLSMGTGSTSYAAFRHKISSAVACSFYQREITVCPRRVA